MPLKRNGFNFEPQCLGLRQQSTVYYINHRTATTETGSIRFDSICSNAVKRDLKDKCQKIINLFLAMLDVLSH